VTSASTPTRRRTARRILASPPTSAVPAARERATREPIDPRIRQRRADVIRRQARRRMLIALGFLAVLLLAGGGWGLVHTRLFAARVVTVVGSTHTPPAQVVAAAGLAGEPPLIDVGAAAVTGVEKLPWVARASVTLHWPDGVRITVVERTPVAVVAEPEVSEGWALVDATGRVLAVSTSRPSGLAQVSGSSPPGAPGTYVRGAAAALEVAASLPKAFAGQVTDVVEGRGGNVTLQLTSPVTVYLGSTVHLAQKYEDVAAVLAGAQLRSGQVIDVAVPGAPVVRN
jgi:cell division protein FtsQ